MIRITVKWDCNLDFSLDYCKPTYQFMRIDDPYAKVAKGWNFRYAQTYPDGSRTQFKVLLRGTLDFVGFVYVSDHFHDCLTTVPVPPNQAYGITFRISTLAKGGKFYMVNLAVNIGSGLGLLALVG